MRRAAVSISSNIAERSSRASRTDCARFVEIATGSLFEVGSQTTIALRPKMIPEKDYNRIYAAAEKQSKMLSGFAQIIIRAVTLSLQPKTLNRLPSEVRSPSAFPDSGNVPLTEPVRPRNGLSSSALCGHDGL